MVCIEPACVFDHRYDRKSRIMWNIYNRPVTETGRSLQPDYYKDERNRKCQY